MGGKEKKEVSKRKETAGIFQHPFFSKDEKSEVENLNERPKWIFVVVLLLEKLAQRGVCASIQIVFAGLSLPLKLKAISSRIENFLTLNWNRQYLKIFENLL